MKLLRPFYLVFLLTLLFNKGIAQLAKCKCNVTGQVNICYFSVDEYCYKLNGCNHALDGTFMKDYLAAKLVNTSNFGLNGISQCKMNLKKITGLTSVKQINEEQCDIFLVGSFPVDTSGNVLKINSDKSSVPVKVLNYVRTWSMQCEKNLVVVAQAEAAPWGYTISNKNINPNTAISDPARFNIFNGPFGNLTQFSQGGSYQGVITNMPMTGSLILAKDLDDNPTVAFDLATNDFILGDIGILCGRAGDLSIGSLINQNNNNDKLAANMFALGCTISTGNKFTDEDVFICQGKNYTLPNGIVVNKEQVVADSFKMENGCDSVHFYKVFLYDQESNTLYKNLCEGDTSNYIFDNATFNEANPVGFGILKNRNGCDSLINVNLIFNKHTNAEFFDNPCFNSGYKRIVGKDTYDESRLNGITKLINRNGCDSTVTVKLNFIHPDTTNVFFTKCVRDSLLFDTKNYESGAVYTITYKGLNPCDSIILLTIDTFQSATYNFTKSVQIDLYKPYIFTNKVSDDIIKIEWQDHEGLSCLDCLNPTFNVASFPSTFAVRLKDIYECDYDIKIKAAYKCSPTLPNVFAPNSSSGNDKMSFYTPCPITSFGVQIFDRWGNVIYESKNAEEQWDGRHNGQWLLPGVYTYRLQFNDLSGHQKVEFGNVTLVR